MNSCLRQRAIVGAVALRQLDLRQEVGRAVDIDQALGLLGVEQAERPRHVRCLHVAEAGADVDDPVAGVAEVVDLDRSASGTRGTGSVSIERITTCWCRTWLCSTLARIASGALCLPRLRKIAVPGTCSSGGRRSCSSSTNARREPSARSRSRVTTSRPRCQVVITANAIEADEQRQPRAVHELGEVRRQEQQVDHQQAAPAENHQPERGPPVDPGEVEEQQRRDGDRR